MTKKELDALEKDLDKCRSFKVIIHNFNNGILKKLLLLRKFKKKFEHNVEFVFGKEFTNEGLDCL